jgi:hypothetical protein
MSARGSQKGVDGVGCLTLITSFLQVAVQLSACDVRWQLMSLMLCDFSCTVHLRVEIYLTLQGESGRHVTLNQIMCECQETLKKCINMTSVTEQHLCHKLSLLRWYHPHAHASFFPQIHVPRFIMPTTLMLQTIGFGQAEGHRLASPVDVSPARISCDCRLCKSNVFIISKRLPTRKARNHIKMRAPRPVNFQHRPSCEGHNENYNQNSYSTSAKATTFQFEEGRFRDAPFLL